MKVIFVGPKMIVFVGCHSPFLCLLSTTNSSANRPLRMRLCDRLKKGKVSMLNDYYAYVEGGVEILPKAKQNQS